MIGRCSELAKTPEKRHIDICAVQDTRLLGPKSYDIGCGYKLIYNETCRTTNGVGIVISAKFYGSVSEVQRYDDFLKKIVQIADRRKVHFFNVYAPKPGLTAEIEDVFWALLDQKTAEVPAEDCLIVTGDLNGHVRQGKADDGAHGGHGYGEESDGGQPIVNYAETQNLVITKT